MLRLIFENINFVLAILAIVNLGLSLLSFNFNK